MSFSEDKAARAISFFHQGIMRPDGGDAKPYQLTAWQYEIVRDVYGTVDGNGRRQYRTVLVLIGKKNGKSEFAAANGLYMLAGDGNPDATIYCAASSSKQTGNVFRPAAAMASRSPLIANDYRVLKSTHVIHSRANPLFNRLEVLSADGDKADGIKCHGVVADELHRWRERKALELWGVLQGGTLSVPEPLIWIITTAGEMDESPLLWQYYEYAKSIQAGSLPLDPSFYFRIYEAAQEDDESDPKTWRKANPSLEPETEERRRVLVSAGIQPGFLRESELRALYLQGTHIAKARADFRRLHLNLWGSKAENECPFDMKAWTAASAIRPLLDRVCYAGLDLSTSTDLTSFTLWFPDDDMDGGDVLSFSWMPEERLKLLEERCKVPYARWSEMPLDPPMMEGSTGVREEPWRVLFLTPGNAVDYTAVREFILRCAKLFTIDRLGYDPKLANETAMWLIEHDIEAVPVAQHGGAISEPFNKAIGMVSDSKVRHGNNPLLTWAMSCARAKQTDDNLIRLRKPDREKDSKRVDPVAALLNAFWCWGRFGMDGPSPYETRGVAFAK